MSVKKEAQYDAHIRAWHEQPDPDCTCTAFEQCNYCFYEQYGYVPSGVYGSCGEGGA